MVQVLPLELCEQVIDCLAFDPEECQWEALAQCSLVCKSWVTRSRRYLWDVIVLSCDNNSDKLNQFLDFLNRSPTLAPLVTRFALHQYREPHDEGHPRQSVRAPREGAKACWWINRPCDQPTLL